MAYRFKGKQKSLALGACPTISLSDARQRREEAKRRLAAGIDPCEARKREQAGVDSFRAIAAEYVARLRKEGRVPRTMSKVGRHFLCFRFNDAGVVEVIRILHQRMDVPTQLRE